MASNPPLTVDFVPEAVSMVDSRCEQPISAPRIRWVWSMGLTY